MIYIEILLALIASCIVGYLWKKPILPEEEASEIVPEPIFIPKPPEVMPEPPKPPEPAPEAPLPPKPAAPMKTTTEKLYDHSKSLLGIHLTLNEAIPRIVGCAQAVSYVLKKFGIAGIPAKGIDGTVGMYDFLKKSGAFKEVHEYKPGRIIISVTGTGNGKCRGHVGICGNTSIMSNNSETGLWSAHWNIVEWEQFYSDYGGIPTRFFEAV